MPGFNTITLPTELFAQHELETNFIQFMRTKYFLTTLRGAARFTYPFNPRQVKRNLRIQLETVFSYGNWYKKHILYFCDPCIEINRSVFSEKHPRKFSNIPHSRNLLRCEHCRLLIVPRTDRCLDFYGSFNLFVIQLSSCYRASTLAPSVIDGPTEFSELYFR